MPPHLTLRRTCTCVLSQELRNKFTVGYEQRNMELWAAARQRVRTAGEAAGDNEADIHTAVEAVLRPAADISCVDLGIQLVLTHCYHYKVLA